MLVVGGTSDIGSAIARRHAAAGGDLILTTREAARIEADAQDIRLRYRVQVTIVTFDILALDTHAALLDRLPRLPDIAVCVVGLLGDNLTSANDPAAARLVMETNYVAPSLLVGLVALRFEVRGSGVIVGISSVAGERGRASNYVYGSAKAGFTAFLSGLRARLSRSSVRIVTVKPGFVATRMTAKLKLPPILTAQPEEVADAVSVALAKKRDVVYVRAIWRMIMSVIRHLPEFIFKKIKA
ncbi:SDR family oxidoreductase [Ancylobacter sp. Lp-2]|uniref:SDR family oxidoreductase n=1 Tax=Ancylobacter sp. Lp-2 TaxID=2881339 RepID=UPI001E39F372|nr:SDR family oxidoreductase [Ancylobacter sp. Lp-2]